MTIKIDCDDPKLDRTPLPTDWESIQELWDAMKKFAKENPNHVFLLRDDPGVPNRAPRFGWLAYLPNDGDEQLKEWTITIRNFGLSLRESPEAKLLENLKTQAGRIQLAQELNQKEEL